MAEGVFPMNRLALGHVRTDDPLTDAGSRVGSGTRGTLSTGETMLDKLDEVGRSVGE